MRSPTVSGLLAWQFVCRSVLVVGLGVNSVSLLQQLHCMRARITFCS